MPNHLQLISHPKVQRSAAHHHPSWHTRLLQLSNNLCLSCFLVSFAFFFPSVQARRKSAQREAVTRSVMKAQRRELSELGSVKAAVEAQLAEQQARLERRRVGRERNENILT